MIAFPDWMISSPAGVSAEQYEQLPEEIRRGVEIIDGSTIVRPAPTRTHQRVVRRLANVLEAACGGRSAVATTVDLRLRDRTLVNRRPDIVVYDRGLPDGEVLRPERCLLVVEIMSPDSITTDRCHKPGEYAGVGIEHFRRAELDDEDRLTLFRFRLEPTTRTYAVAGAHTGKMVVSDPFTVAVDLDELLG